MSESFITIPQLVKGTVINVSIHIEQLYTHLTENQKLFLLNKLADDYPGVIDEYTEESEPLSYYRGDLD